MRYNDYKTIIRLNKSILEDLKSIKCTENFNDPIDCFLNSLLLSKEKVLQEEMDNYGDIIFQFKLVEKFLSSLQIKNAIEQMEILCEKCITEIDYKIKVLFFAELGGKWDSMASVYYSMKRRSDCIVDVVLQPVFRTHTLEDGTIKEEIVYNDYLTDMGISYIPYNEYDMKTELPDITFMSQPYESCTYPMFWPENISKYSRLVYLPYFTAINFNDYTTAFNSFFNLNTQKYSWRIPCQSEKMKDYYKANASHRGKNVIVTGLPKWDYPMSLNKDNTPIPEAWYSKLNGKKVFLWNTHFSLSTCGSQVLGEKSAEFIKYFIKNPDIALIWRPHPMLETVIKTYYSEEEWNYYVKLKRIVEKSSNIVIDTNDSYAASFVWSDALISDFSTLADQYIFMNKPVLMLTLEKSELFLEQFNNDVGLSDYSKLAFADSLDMEKKFIDDVRKNSIQKYLSNQKYIIDNYFGMADGKCGERVADNLITELKKNILSADIKTDILIVGPIEDSLACMKQFEEKRLDYYLCDMFISTEKKSNYNVFSLLEIEKYEYEAIVITDKKNSNFLKTILVEEYSISKEKIMVFWELYNAFLPLMKCDKEMLNPKQTVYEGIIIGISHTEVGLLANQFSHNFCNLALSSQDLFNQYNTLLYCFGRYPDKLKELKYVIIDLYDYNYFNYDTSLSKNAVNYWINGGFNILPHNFSKNDKFSEDYENIMSYIKNYRFSDINSNIINKFTEWFADIFYFTDFEGFEDIWNYGNRMNIVSDRQIDEYEYTRNTVSKVYKETIIENTKLFKQMLRLIFEFNPNMKVYTVVIPKYIETEINDKMLLDNHKEYFNQIVKEAQEEYPFIHFDLKELTDISSNRLYYNDAAHLNYYGAYVLTKIIDENICNTN